MISIWQILLTLSWFSAIQILAPAKSQLVSMSCSMHTSHNNANAFTYLNVSHCIKKKQTRKQNFTTSNNKPHIIWPVSLSSDTLYPMPESISPTLAYPAFSLIKREINFCLVIFFFLYLKWTYLPFPIELCSLGKRIICSIGILAPHYSPWHTVALSECLREQQCRAQRKHVPFCTTEHQLPFVTADGMKAA